MDPRFVHLHVHSEYSLVDGLLRVKPLIKAVAAGGMPAVAVTDQANLFALVRFYKAAVAAGVKPIAGTDLWLRNPDDPNKPYRLVLLVQDIAGYRNLSRLISRAYREGQHLGVPQVERAWLAAAADGLIALSGGPQGDLGHALLSGNRDQAEPLLADWLAVFGDRYYLELMRTGREDEAEYLDRCVDLAARHGVPVVATNDVRFLTPEDFEAHEARVCIHDGRTLDDPRRPRRYSEQQYLRSPQEMAELFSDLPEALENSVEIAKRCNLELTLGKNFLPDFPVPQGQTVGDFFTSQSRQGLEGRLARILDPSRADCADRRRVYDERLALELRVIDQMGFAGYFLIVADFIQWAKDQGIPVGPGRGSGAGSLVAYALKITDLDPIAHDLLFERFLNPERVSMPDFDVDFCMEGRDRVIDYVARRYGRDAVSQIITFGTMAAKAVVRDVGRVMSHPYGFVDRIAKLVPFELGMTLVKALAESEDLRQAYRDDEEVRAIIDMARKLEGLARNAGKHAGGVVIAPTVLTDFVPLYCEPGGDNLLTQYDKDDVEQAGLVKFDFLGLRTLTIIDWALKTVNAIRGKGGEPPIDIDAIPMDDGDAFRLLKRCETTAVFQLESRGMKELVKKLQPDCFDDITALVALFRPGPLQSGMVDDFINRKHGRAQVAYPHPDLEPILKPTYGVILYQEQVMQIAQVLAGYTLGGADLLRRAMGKKKAEEMAKQRAVFVHGSTARRVDEAVASHIFDLMEKFAGYGFNKTLHCDTLIKTATGIKRIEDCQAGDRVIAFNPDGSLSHTRVVARHDHGLVPLWEIIFDDGTRERCTLDHKWLTRHGQLPLWAIIQMDEQVWGSTFYQTRYPRPPERMSPVHGHDPYRPVIGQGADHALWRKSTHTRKSHRAFSPMPDMPGDTPPNSAGHLQKPGTYRSNAAKICGNREENLGTAGYSSGTGRAPQALAAEQSRAFSGNRGQSAWLAQTLENGGMAGAASGASGVCQKYPPAYLAQPRPNIGTDGRWQLDGHTVLRQPVRATFLGWQQGYDLEVAHQEHNFLLASGLCCSNSHSAAYALVSYQTLWLKTHYPAAFMAAVLSADMDNTDKVVTLIEECRAMKLAVEPPAINRSEYRFTIADDRTVVYGIGAIKGVGESAIEAMLEARRRGGAFRDLWDFCRRIDLHKANRRVLEALIRAGALDELGANRATLMAQLPMALKMAEQYRESQAAGQVDLFGAVGEWEYAAVAPDPQLVRRTWDEWEEEERLQGEKETLGLYLTGHPINRYEQELQAMVSTRIGDLLETSRDRNDREKRTVAGLVVSVRHGKTSRGRMGTLVLDDRTGRIEVTCFAELYEQVRELLVADRILVVTGSMSFDEYRDNWSLRAGEVRPLEQARAALADHIALVLDLGDPSVHARGAALLAGLRTTLAAFRGGNLPVELDYRRPGSRGRLILGDGWRVQPTEDLLKRLRHLLGPDAVRVSYERPLSAAAGPEEPGQRPRLAVVK